MPLLAVYTLRTLSAFFALAALVDSVLALIDAVALCSRLTARLLTFSRRCSRRSPVRHHRAWHSRESCAALSTFTLFSCITFFFAFLRIISSPRFALLVNTIALLQVAWHCRRVAASQHQSQHRRAWYPPASLASASTRSPSRRCPLP